MFALKQGLENLNSLVQLTANRSKAVHLHLLFFNFGLSLFEFFFQGRGLQVVASLFAMHACHQVNFSAVELASSELRKFPCHQLLGRRDAQPVSRSPASTARCRRCSTSTRPWSTPTTRPYSSAGHAPTPVEYLLHAIAACLTAGIANIAAARGVELTKVTLDRRGRHRPARHPRALRRRRCATATSRSRSPSTSRATPTTRPCARIVEQSRRRSAVYDALTNPTPVAIDVVTG